MEKENVQIRQIITKGCVFLQQHIRNRFRSLLTVQSFVGHLFKLRMQRFIPTIAKRKKTGNRMITAAILVEHKNQMVNTGHTFSNSQVDTQINHVALLDNRHPPAAVPHVTDLSGTSRGALPPPARGTAFELLLAVMFVSKPATHLMDKHKRMSKVQKRLRFTRVNNRNK